MFLISAHQTYLNSKLLKERLSARRHNSRRINKASTIIYSFGTHYSEIILETNQSSTSLMNRLLGVNLSKRNELVQDNLTIKQQNNLPIDRMQRTKKYYSSDGNKFLFNNT